MATQRKTVAEIQAEALALLPNDGTEVPYASFVEEIDAAGLSAIRPHLMGLKRSGVLVYRAEASEEGHTVTLYVKKPNPDEIPF